MARYANLDIALWRERTTGYRVEMLFAGPNDQDRVQTRPTPLNFHFSELESCRHDAGFYGRILARDMFADAGLRRLFNRARQETAVHGLSLRVRLSLAADLNELHTLHWETLCIPETGRPLFADRRFFFSRVVANAAGQTEPGKLTDQMKATVAIANPRGLRPLNLEEERAHAASDLSGLTVVEQQPATLDGIGRRVGEGCDLMYLVCRASIHNGKPYLWLENENGMLAHASHLELQNRIKRARHPPRLLILKSPETEPSGQNGPLALLAAMLVQAGMPAVLAFLGPISASTVRAFLPVFVRRLKEHGTPDRALAEARESIASAPDFWMPALFLCGKLEHLWLKKAEPHLGRRIGPYRLVRKLGQGGMGAVYLGVRQDQEIEMSVAVKLAHERIATQDLLDRFRRERQLLANLKHPHIGMLHDAGTTEDGHPFVIMEYIEGRTIDKWCAAHQPSLDRLLRLFRRIVAAVGFAHGKGVIHRDLKPGNLMVTPEGVPKLLDFGIARFAKQGEPMLTGTDQALMTPEYASPEQLFGREVKEASDVYALGLVLVELLTGKRPGKWGCTPLEAVTSLIAEGRPRSTTKVTVDPAAITGTLPIAQETEEEAAGSAGTPAEPTFLQTAALKTIDGKDTVSVFADTVTVGTENADTVPTAIMEPENLSAEKAVPAPSLEQTPRRKGPKTEREPLPEALGHVLRSALEENPEYRYATTTEFIKDLDRVLAGLPREIQPGTHPRKQLDVLMWYHPDDRRQVERLARHLTINDLKVWLDVWSLRPGQDLVQETGIALDESRVCLVFVGAGGRVPWQGDTITRDRLAFHAGELHTLPVLLPGALFPEKQSELPSALRNRVWFTFSKDLDEKEMDRLARTVKDICSEDEEELVPTGVCPFRGLEVFREQDRDYFFGREAISQRIIQYLKEHPFIGVLGPSGSGKSSVVRAGVVPYLAEHGFATALLTPTAHPLEELAFTLSGLFQKLGKKQPTEYLLNRLRGSRQALHFIARELFEGKPDKLCLVIDQFEEVFTLAGEPVQRDRFVELLCFALDQPQGKVSVLLTMRSDFLGKNVIFPDLNTYILDCSLQVPPMDREDLTRAIGAPSRLAGLRLESGLLDKILDDVTGAAGELPLLEHALLELYERRKGGLLTWHAYEEIGGIEGALARRAEAEYAMLDENARNTLRKMFTLCLVHPGEGVEDTRRRATREELLAVGSSPEVVASLLDRWMAARLLTGSGDEARNREMVDVAHEALIRKWDRIRTWMAEDRETARLLVRLRMEARSWENAGRDKDLLLRGGPLYQMKDLVDRESANLGPLEKAFVAAGLRQTRRRKNLAVLVGCFGFVLAAVAFWMFLKARSSQHAALGEKLKAEQRTREGNYNLAMMFDERAGTALADNRPQEAWLFALAALSRDLPAGATLPGAIGRFADPDMEGAGRMLWTSPVATPANRVAYNPTGTLLALAGMDHSVRLVDVASGGPVAVLAGHTNLVKAMAFSPDGNLMVTGSVDRELRIWQVPTDVWQSASSKWVLKGHQGEVTDAVFSPDGEVVASSSSDGTVRLWRAETGKQERVWDMKDGPIRCLAISSDGKWLAYGFQNGDSGLIDADSGEERQIELGIGVRDLCFVPGNLVLACEDGLIRLVDPGNGRTIRAFEAHRGPVAALEPVPGETRLASLGLDGAIAIRDLALQEKVAAWVAFPPLELEAHRADGDEGFSEAIEDDEAENQQDQEDGEEEDEDDEDEPETDSESVDAGPVASLAVAPAGNFTAAVLNGNFPKFWERGGQRQVAAMAGHSSEVLSVAFSPDGKFLATASADQRIMVWDTVRRTLMASLSGHSSEVLGLAFSPDGGTLASASGDETVRLWDPVRQETTAVLDGHDSEVLTLSFSPDGRMLATGSGDNTIKIWNVAQQKLLATLNGHSAKVAAVVFSPDGRLLASASEDMTLRLWDVARRSLVKVLTGHTANLVGAAFSPDGSVLASSSDDQTVRLWDPKQKRLVVTLTGHYAGVAGLAFSPDGKRLASGSDDRTVRIWDLRTQKTVMTLSGHASAVAGVAFSPDGRLLASASEDRTARLWDVTGDQSSARLGTYEAAVTSLAFSPDQRHLATGSEDRTIKIWDLERRELSATLTGHESDVSCVAFSPDGQLLASSSDDETIRLWRGPSWDLLTELKGHDS